ncbi:hypothetical protein [Bosea vestrisii]|uniref:Uncharacterized protein n=1 Tax=Bosea vestrisii TaxID=151416 RepID=A0ABW0HAS1_9HYPH
MPLAFHRLGHGGFTVPRLPCQEFSLQTRRHDDAPDWNKRAPAEIVTREVAQVMPQDWSFVVWIVILAIPAGLMLATFWSRSRQPGAARLDGPSKDDPRDPL